MRFEGKVALITGGSLGMGRAMALAFANEGAKVAIAARRPEHIEDALGEIRKTGAEAIGIQTDVTKEDQVVAMVDRTMEAFGQVDVLIANAGMGGMKRIMDMTLDEFMEPFWLNNAGTFLCCREVLKKSMLPRKTGAIVTVSSVAAKKAVPLSGRLSASKAGIIGFTQALAIEVGRDGIRANCICPGAILTPRLKVFLDEQVERTGRSFEDLLNDYAAGAALGRIATPEEAAKLTLFLCSDEASGMTGQALNISAGSEMR